MENFPDVEDIPSKITIEEIIESQEHDELCKNIRSVINDRDIVRFQDNPDTEVLESLPPNHIAAVIIEVL